MLDPRRLIKNLKKRHKPTEEFSAEGLTHLVMVTEGQTKKGAGILEHIWEIGEAEAVWISEGRLCVFLKPDATLESSKLDRYANEIPEEKKHENIVKLKSKKERMKEVIERNKTKRRFRP